MPALAEALGGLTRAAGEKATNWLRSSELGGMFQDFFRSQKTEFMRGTPQGEELLAMTDRYTQIKNQLWQGQIKPIKELTEHLKDDPMQMRQPLGTLHQTFSAQPNHPMLPYTSQLMAADPMNAGDNLNELAEKAGSKARLQARSIVFGPKSEEIMRILMPLYDSPDPTMHSHADAMTKILANVFHDTTVDPLGASASRTKLDLRSAMALEDKQRAAAGLAPILYDHAKMSTSSVYVKRNELEKILGRRARLYLAPLIVIPHMSTFFNLSWAPLTAIGKTLASWSDPQLAQFLETTGIYTGINHAMLEEEIKNSTGLIGSKTKPIYGRVTGQMFHNPGFNFLRKIQLQTAGIVGYHSAMYWGEQAARGDKRAILELKELGLDHVGIARRGGQLTDPEKQQAVFNFVNNRVFVDRALDRSLMGTSNPWMRLLTFFHGYVTNQQQFMRRELQKMLDAGDYKGIARFAGTVGVAFPVIAPMIKSLETLGHTASPQAAGASLQEDYGGMAHPHSVSGAMHEYLDLMSYFGTWGVFFHFIEASHNDRLALQLMGPMAGSATRTAQDLINYATNPSKAGKHNIRPLAKDVLQQTVPVGGNILANRLFPKKKKGT